MPHNYNKTKPSEAALLRRPTILLVGLLLGSLALAYSHPGTTAERQGATNEPITARPTANRFDFASETFRTLLRHQTQTRVTLALSKGAISERRTSSTPPRTLNGNTKRAAKLESTRYSDTHHWAGKSRSPSQTPQRSKHSKAPNVAGWNKVPTVQSFGVPRKPKSTPARLPPSRNWKSPRQTRSGNKSNTIRSRPKKPVSSKTRSRTKRVKRRKAVKKKAATPAINWQHDVLFDD